MKATRERILAEAARRLADVGYATFTVASVRDALGVSSGSMFHAYPSKASLAAAVYVDGIEAYQHTAIAALGRGTKAGKSLRALIAAHLGWVQDHRGLAAFLFSTLPDEVAQEASAQLGTLNAAFHVALDSFYVGAIEQGLMAPLQRQLAHAICIGPAQEYCRQWIRGNATRPPREVSQTIANASLAALRSTLRTPPPTKRAKETRT